MYELPKFTGRETASPNGVSGKILEANRSIIPKMQSGMTWKESTEYVKNMMSFLTGILNDLQNDLEELEKSGFDLKELDRVRVAWRRYVSEFYSFNFDLKEFREAADVMLKLAIRVDKALGKIK